MAQTNETLEKYLHNQLELEAEGRMVGEEKVNRISKTNTCNTLLIRPKRREREGKRDTTINH